MHPEKIILSPKCKKLNDIYFYNTINLRTFNSPIYILEIPRPARANHGPRDKLVNTGPPSLLTLTLMTTCTNVYFLIAINEEIASEILAKNRQRI